MQLHQPCPIPHKSLPCSCTIHVLFPTHHSCTILPQCPHELFPPTRHLAALPTANPHDLIPLTRHLAALPTANPHHQTSGRPLPIANRHQCGESNPHGPN